MFYAGVILTSANTSTSTKGAAAAEKEEKKHASRKRTSDGNKLPGVYYCAVPPRLVVNSFDRPSSGK